MPPKKRNPENTQYPKNWRIRQRGSRFYILYRVPVSARHLWDNKQEAILGVGDTRGAAERNAYVEWARRIACDETPLTFRQAFDRYEAEVVPAKSPATQKSNRYSLKRLRLGIPGEMPVVSFRAHHAYQYRDACAREQSPKKANLDMEVLSHIFTKCFEWGTPGLIEHPIRGKVPKLSLASRERYPEDWEVEAFLSVASPMQRVYVPLKYALGIDKSIMLRLQLANIKPDGLEVMKRPKIKSNARAKKKFYPFEHQGETTGLRELIDDVLAWRRSEPGLKNVISPWLFCVTHKRAKRGGGFSMPGDPMINERGETSGFDSAWQRTMQVALETTALKERFTEHDLCAKSASDVETDEQAAQLRGHLNIATTVKTYRRKPQTVMPLKGK